MRKTPAKHVKERFLQEACALFLYGLMMENQLLFNHCPNEGKRSVYGNISLKKQGMMPGWPDLDIQKVNDDLTHGVRFFVELKTPAGVLTDNQDQCHARLRLLGYDVHVVKAAFPLEAVNELRKIMRGYGFDV